jgi:hypothetical protein
MRWIHHSYCGRSETASHIGTFPNFSRLRRTLEIVKPYDPGSLVESFAMDIFGEAWTTLPKAMPLNPKMTGHGASLMFHHH